MRLIGFFVKFIFLFSFLISLAAGSLFAYSLHDTPIISKTKPLSPQQIRNVKTFIKDNNPFNFQLSNKRTTAINETDLNLFISHSLLRFDDRIRTKIRLFKDSAFITTSLKLPSNPLGKYLNISSELTNKDQKLHIFSLDIGNIPVPNFISAFFLKLAQEKISSQFIEYQYVINSITDFKFQKQQASINYVWDQKLAHQIKNRIASRVISPVLLNNILAYTKKLSEVTRSISMHKPSISKLLNPMFSYAIKRSENNNPVEENRALFITLGAHMLGKNIPLLLGDRTVEHVIRRNYYLHNRNDLSKHFLISSALTALANPSIARAIGLEKEIDDSEGGSGFSFADLAADRAGVALANTGFASTHKARVLQQHLASVQYETDFMPSITSLQEGLQDIDFKIAYKHTNSLEYNRVISVIDQRINECAVYQTSL